MKEFTPDPERENEALWGDKRGHSYVSQQHTKEHQERMDNFNKPK